MKLSSQWASVLVLGLGLLGAVSAADVFHVCEAGDPAFLGDYAKGSETMDGVAVYSNANDLSFFRNKGFWYLGNLGPWPPETHYRCVEPEGCGPGAETPPLSAEGGGWSASKRFGKEPVPVVTATPCASSAVDEL